jgi:hypothetical protein
MTRRSTTSPSTGTSPRRPTGSSSGLDRSLGASDMTSFDLGRVPRPTTQPVASRRRGSPPSPTSRRGRESPVRPGVPARVPSMRGDRSMPVTSTPRQARRGSGRSRNRAPDRLRGRDLETTISDRDSGRRPRRRSARGDPRDDSLDTRDVVTSDRGVTFLRGRDVQRREERATACRRDSEGRTPLARARTDVSSARAPSAPRAARM